MRIPSKRVCRKVVTTLLRRYGVKTVNHKRWIHRKKKKYACSLLANAGFTALEQKLNRLTMYVNYKNKPMILTPGNVWRGKMSRHQRVAVVATFAHELAHHKHCTNMGWIQFYVQYFKGSKFRASAEVKGCCAAADIYATFGSNDMYDVDNVFDRDWARLYRMDNEHVASAKSGYTRRIAAHKRNLCSTDIGAEVLREFERHT